MFVSVKNTPVVLISNIQIYCCYFQNISVDVQIYCYFQNISVDVRDLWTEIVSFFQGKVLLSEISFIIFNRIFCEILMWQTQQKPTKNYKQFLISSPGSSHQKCSIKKVVLKNLAKFTGKRLCQSLFFKKRDSDTCVFL